MCQRTSTSKCLQFPAPINSFPPSRTFQSLACWRFRASRVLNALYPHIKAEGQADSEPAVCRTWLQTGRSSMKWFLVTGSPLPPRSQGPRSDLQATFWTREMLAVRHSNQTSGCRHAHEHISTPAVEVYCFPSPQLAVRHLIQQSWPSASSAPGSLPAVPRPGHEIKAAGHLNGPSLCFLTFRFSSQLH